MPGHPTQPRQAASPPRPPVARAFLSDEAWSVSEIVCAAGPSDPAFEERHGDFSISAVIEGAFTYRSNEGGALLYPGALLLGNSGGCFACGHEHGVGDRCVSLHVDDALFAEIAATAAASGRFRFPFATLAPSTRISPILARMESLASRPERFRCEEIVLDLVEEMIAGMSGRPRADVAPNAIEARRVIEGMRLMTSDLGRSTGLGELAARAGLSKYHYLRVFRRIAGVTPHQYLLAARLRRAALALRASRRPVIEIALDCGFGDLSTFNRHFRKAFGATPSAYRAS